MGTEPTATTSAIGLFLSSLVKAAVLLHLVDWDADQLAGVSLVIDSALVVFGALFIRARVTPTSNPTLPAGTTVTVTDPSPTVADTKTVL